MDKETFIKILSEQSLTFNRSELMELMNAELEKSEDEMDVDFICRCLDALDTKNVQQKDNTKSKRIKLGRLLLIAAIVAVIISIAVPAGAKLLRINADNGVVNYNKDHFDINLSNDNTDLKATLEDNGIGDVILPSCFYDGYKVTDFSVFKIEDNNCVTYTMSIEKDIICAVNIDAYEKSYEFSNGDTKGPNNFSNVEQIEVDGIKALVFSDETMSYIYYIVDNFEYNITLDCNSEKAMEIAKTIGE